MPRTFERIADPRLHCRGILRHASICCGLIAFLVALASPCHACSTIKILGPGIDMTNLVKNASDLIVGDKEFTQFSISGDYQASHVYVTPIEEAGNFGIRFSGAFAACGQAKDMTLTYSVSVTNSPNLISAANLLFNGQVTFGTGLAQIVEQVFTNDDFAMPAGQLQVFCSIASNKCADSLPITPPQPSLDLSKDVLLYAQVPAFATISTIDQTFTQVSDPNPPIPQVPEPSVLALVAAGCAGLILLRNRPWR
jgi:hypothetical protein